MVSLYFDKKRPLAYGIASCGSGLGILVIPIMDAVGDIGWRGILRVEAGLLLGCVILALCLRPLPKAKDEDESHLLMQQTKHLSDIEFLVEVKREFSKTGELMGHNNNEFDVRKDIYHNDTIQEASESWEVISESEIPRIAPAKTITIAETDTRQVSQADEDLRGEEGDDIISDTIIEWAAYREISPRFSIGSKQNMSTLPSTSSDSKMVPYQEPAAPTPEENADSKALTDLQNNSSGNDPEDLAYCPDEVTSALCDASSVVSSTFSINGELDQTDVDTMAPQQAHPNNLEWSVTIDADDYVVIDFPTDLELEELFTPISYKIQLEAPQDRFLLEPIYEEQMVEEVSDIPYVTEISTDTNRIMYPSGYSREELRGRDKRVQFRGEFDLESTHSKDESLDEDLDDSIPVQALHNITSDQPPDGTQTDHPDEEVTDSFTETQHTHTQTQDEIQDPERTDDCDNVLTLESHTSVENSQTAESATVVEVSTEDNSAHDYPLPQAPDTNFVPENTQIVQAEIVNQAAFQLSDDSDAEGSQATASEHAHEALGTLDNHSNEKPAPAQVGEENEQTRVNSSTSGWRKTLRSVSFAVERPAKTNIISLGAVNDFYRQKSSRMSSTSVFNQVRLPNPPSKGVHKRRLKKTFDISVFKNPLFIFATIHSLIAPLGE